MLSFPVFSWRMSIRIGELFGAQYDYDCLLDDDECLVNKWACVMAQKPIIHTISIDCVAFDSMPD